MGDVEQQLRMNNVILTGLQLRLRARPDAANVSTDAAAVLLGQQTSVESQVGSFLTSKRIFLDKKPSSSANRFPGEKRRINPHEV